MKSFSSLTLILISALIIDACGAQATPPPTINPMVLQGTVAAAAFTMIAETQAAIPTATPLPPTPTLTNTPLPTDTLPPLPPPGVTFTPVPNSNSGGGDPCINKTLPETLKGVPIKVRINNSTKVKLALSVYLNQNGPQGECGYRTYTIAAGESIVLNNLVEACYTLWAWNPDPEGYFIVTNGTDCLDTSNTWVFDISTGSIKMKT